jgi:hypothetical protein|tara:strand:+ start:327 stop:2186 length:1860 start_codon:yes stop_codon:yes gene_type:complete
MSYKIFSKKMKNFMILDDHKIKNLIKLIFCITIFYFFILFVVEKIKISTFLYLSYLFFVNYFLFYLYLSIKKEKNYFPIYPLIIFYYLLTYSCYFYFDQRMLFSETLELLPYLILIISLGIISFSVGYFAPNYLNSKKKIYAFKIVNKYEYLLIFFFIIILIFYYINYPNRFVTSNILQQLKEPLIFFLLAYFQIKYLDTKKNSILILNIFLLLFFFIVEISFGSTAFPYLLVGLVISINYYKQKKINIITISLVFLSLIVIHDLKDEIRKITWSSYIVTETSIKENKLNIQKKKGALDSLNNQLVTSTLKLNSLENEKFKLTDEYNLLNQKILNLKSEISRINKSLNEDLSLYNSIIENTNNLNKDNFDYHYDVVTNTYKKTTVDNKITINNLNEIIKNVTDTFGVINTNLLSLEGLDNMNKNINLITTKKRFFHSNISLQVVIGQTPKVRPASAVFWFQDVDFFNGKSYVHLHKKLLPRFINKNKPKEVWGNFWGKRYRVLSTKDPNYQINDEDNTTSWNFPILNEFFANYGLKGVIIGMFLLGMFIKTLMITLLINSSSAVVCSGVCVIIFNFFYQENNLSMVLGKIISYSTFFGIIFISILIANYFLERIMLLKK